MRRRQKTGLEWLALTALVVSAAPRVGANAVYSNFHSTAGLILQAHAQTVDGRLRLSPAIGGLGLGGAWLDAKQPVKEGFDTTFQVQITDKYVHGADGLAFVIQNRPAPALGQTGREIGFGGLTNLLVVKFDDYHWRNDVFVASDEIAVLAADSPMAVLLDRDTEPIASVKSGVVFSDGRIHTVRIHYVPGNLQVFLDDLENPLMTVYVNLARLVDLDDDRAWVGFTAASGADWQNHDLLSWTFHSSADTEAARPLPQTVIVNPTPSPMPVYLGTNGQALSTTPLPADPAFGYSLPNDAGPNPQIEASSNLVQWSSLTNAAYYFRDPDSTNYPQRFYRFRKN